MSIATTLSVDLGAHNESFDIDIVCANRFPRCVTADAHLTGGDETGIAGLVPVVARWSLVSQDRRSGSMRRRREHPAYSAAGGQSGRLA